MSGRLLASLIAGLLLAPGLASAQDAPPPVEVDAEIVLAVDASRSMDLTEFAVQRDGYLQALRHPELIRAITAGPAGRIAIAYFEWSGQAQDGSLVPWRIIDGPAAAASLADEIAAMPVRRTRGTSISRALYFATVLIEDGAVEGARRVVDISGDGANNVGPPVTGARDEAVARGITINGLPICHLGLRRPARPRPLLRGLRHRRRGRLHDGGADRRGTGADHPPQADPRDQRPRAAAADHPGRFRADRLPDRREALPPARMGPGSASARPGMLRSAPWRVGER